MNKCKTYKQQTASHLMSQQSKQIALSVHNGDSPDRGDELLLADLHGELLLRLVLLVRLQHLQHQGQVSTSLQHLLSSVKGSQSGLFFSPNTQFNVQFIMHECDHETLHRTPVMWPTIVEC